MIWGLFEDQCPRKTLASPKVKENNKNIQNLVCKLINKLKKKKKHHSKRLWPLKFGHCVCVIS